MYAKGKSFRQSYLTRADADLGEGLYDSIAWAFEEHVQTPDTREFNFAVLYDNEDSPSKIEFWREEPNYDTPADYIWERTED